MFLSLSRGSHFTFDLYARGGICKEGPGQQDSRGPRFVGPRKFWNEKLAKENMSILKPGIHLLCSPVLASPYIYSYSQHFYLIDTLTDRMALLVIKNLEMQILKSLSPRIGDR